MRGTLQLSPSKACSSGIIPADAGNTPALTSDRYVLTDHPRGCGEHKCQRVALRDGWGSSPRMRGTLNVSSSGIDVPWIIPADAGNTLLGRKVNRLWGDHPRGCGEHLRAT